MKTSEIQIVVASTLKPSATTDVAGIWILLIKKKSALMLSSMEVNVLFFIFFSSMMPEISRITAHTCRLILPSTAFPFHVLRHRWSCKSQRPQSSTWKYFSDIVQWLLMNLTQRVGR